MKYNVFIIGLEDNEVVKIGENLPEPLAYIKMKNAEKKLQGTPCSVQMVKVDEITEEEWKQCKEDKLMEEAESAMRDEVYSFEN